MWPSFLSRSLICFLEPFWENQQVNSSMWSLRKSMKTRPIFTKVKKTLKCFFLKYPAKSNEIHSPNRKFATSVLRPAYTTSCLRCMITPNLNPSLQMVRQPDVHQEKSLQTAHDWHHEDRLSNNLGQYREQCINMLSKLKFMWDRPLRRMSTAKDYIRLKIVNAPPFNSDHIAQYRWIVYSKESG